MGRARWWVLGALATATGLVLVLDVAVVGLDGRPHAAWGTVATPTSAPPSSEAPAPPPVLEPLPIGTTDLTRQDVAARLAPLLRDDDLGDAVSVLVAGADGTVLFQRQARRARTPASTLKLLTALTALDRLDPDRTLTTSVVATEQATGNASVPRLVLIGGGDATLTVERVRGPGAHPASLQELARSTADVLTASGVSRVRLDYDDSLFTGPAISPRWEEDYVTTGVVAPISALMADRGLVREGSADRHPDPAVAAAADLARLLAASGVEVRGTPRRTVAAEGQPVATVDSPPVTVLVERMLVESDNELAEALGRLAAAEAGRPASFAGASRTLRTAVANRGLGTPGLRIDDASGLARGSRIPASTLAAVLSAAVADDPLRPALTGLPVAGFTGTLEERYRTVGTLSGAGTVRAKTGTLTGVAAEAGQVVTRSGDLLVVVVLADEVTADLTTARTALDRVFAALARL